MPRATQVIGGWCEDGSWLNPLLAAHRFQPGEAFRIETTGGGGWGSPLARELKLVLDDVLDGYISIDVARDSYGVVIDPEKLDIDIAATDALRAKAAAAD